MSAFIAASLVMAILLFICMPRLEQIFNPILPTAMPTVGTPAPEVSACRILHEAV